MVLITSVGPVEEAVRDRLKAFRDERGCSNYNEAIVTLLDDVDVTQEE